MATYVYEEPKANGKMIRILSLERESAEKEDPVLDQTTSNE